jgi:hypothetical protein
MKILLIDSHKGTMAPAQNLHWLNADKLKNYLVQLGHSVDFIWSYPSVNDDIKEGYDRIIMNHTSRYSYISNEWITKSPNAKMFYITNEYNLGEPLVLWSFVKSGSIKYDVIANHPAAASKVVKKYVDNWHILNLNALIVEEEPLLPTHDFFTVPKDNCVYYGSFRKNRTAYFQKYLTGNIVVSTHMKNREKFNNANVAGPFRDRINWSKNGLAPYKTSLYIEDDVTHTNYNFLANRFYESLNYNVFPLFDTACKNTLSLSGYNIPDYAMVDSPEQVDYITNNLPDSATEYFSEWRKQALDEKNDVLHKLSQIIL